MVPEPDAEPEPLALPEPDTLPELEGGVSDLELDDPEPDMLPEPVALPEPDVLSLLDLALPPPSPSDELDAEQPPMASAPTRNGTVNNKFFLFMGSSLFCLDLVYTAAASPLALL
jgi:hypothetical protein